MDQPSFSQNTLILLLVLAAEQLGGPQDKAVPCPLQASLPFLKTTGWQSKHRKHVGLSISPLLFSPLKDLPKLFHWKCSPSRHNLPFYHLLGNKMHFRFSSSLSPYFRLRPHSPLLNFLLFSVANPRRRRKRGEVVAKPNVWKILPLKHPKIQAFSPFSKNNRRKSNWKCSRIVTISSFLTIPRK